MFVCLLPVYSSLCLYLLNCVLSQLAPLSSTTVFLLFLSIVLSNGQDVVVPAALVPPVGQAMKCVDVSIGS